MKKSIWAILASTVWVSLSEFTRNELLLKTYWTTHYKQLGLIFPSDPINGVLWVVWSLCFSIVVFFISQKYNLLQTTILTWFLGFAMMWIVIGNMNVLPFSILPFALPLSILESYIATLIIKKITKHE